ncbi:hypothetical protein ACWKSP_22245 [Micromonosporaceae bacterium Da 78-11]
MTDVEYTQMECDSWQMHHLANDWAARYGWEVVSVVNVRPDIEVPHKVGDENGPTYRAINPVSLLFRRPIPDEEN